MLNQKKGQTSIEYILLFAVAVSLVLLIGIVTLSTAENTEIKNVTQKVTGTVEQIEKNTPDRLKYLP